jgi:hypothetical protein
VSRAGIVGLLAVVVAIVAIGVAVVLVASGEDNSLVLDLEAGDCFRLPDDMSQPTIGNVETVDCDDPHDAEVFATGELNPDRDQPYPDDAARLFARVDRACADVLAGDPAVVDRFGVLPVVADEASWEPFRGRYVCVAVPYGGGTTVGSVDL